MCIMCSGKDQRWLERKIISDVKRCGWHVTLVHSNDGPPWAYTIGLHRAFRHPEILLFGLPEKSLGAIVTELGRAVRSGRSFQHDSVFRDDSVTHPLVFKRVARLWYPEILVNANWFNGGLDYPALQCVWPDEQGRFPWQPGFNRHWLEHQPLLYEVGLRSPRQPWGVRDGAAPPGWRSFRRTAAGRDSSARTTPSG